MKRYILNDYFFFELVKSTVSSVYQYVHISDRCLLFIDLYYRLYNIIDKYFGNFIINRCVSINSLAFSHDSMLLCASSNTETVHIFKLEEQEEA